MRWAGARCERCGCRQSSRRPEAGSSGRSSVVCCRSWARSAAFMVRSAGTRSRYRSRLFQTMATSRCFSTDLRTSPLPNSFPVPSCAIHGFGLECLPAWAPGRRCCCQVGAGCLTSESDLNSGPRASQLRRRICGALLPVARPVTAARDPATARSLQVAGVRATPAEVFFPEHLLIKQAKYREPERYRGWGLVAVIAVPAAPPAHISRKPLRLA
jgi:hypothetical protein